MVRSPSQARKKWETLGRPCVLIRKLTKDPATAYPSRGSAASKRAISVPIAAKGAILEATRSTGCPRQRP